MTPTPSQLAQQELLNSAISPELAAVATKIVPDLELDPLTQEVIATPLADLMGWRYVRFGHRPNLNQAAIAFFNEDGELWQIKRGFGLPEGEIPKNRYLAPRAAGNKIFTPGIDETTLAKICARHGLDLNETTAEIAAAGGFWPWLLGRADLPILVTEGAKKSLAALSQGHVAIALYGCLCGGSQHLSPYLRGRKIIAALDSDSKESARKAVSNGLYKLNTAVASAGGRLFVATWAPDHGKGVDDLIANHGPKAFDSAVAAAVTFKQWAARRRDSRAVLEAARDRAANPLGYYSPDLRVNVPDLSRAIGPESIPDRGIVAISSATGTGKTLLIKELVEEREAVVAPGHRVSLQRGLSQRLGLDYVNDSDCGGGRLIGPDGRPTTRIGLCWDSLLSVPESFYHNDYDLILDEVDQGLRHLISGATCGKDGRRPGLVQRARRLIMGARRVIVASATLGSAELDLICSLRGESAWILKNDYQGGRYPVRFYTGDRSQPGSTKRARGSVLASIMAAIATGDRVVVACDQLRTAKIVAKIGRWAGLAEEDILEFHRETSTGDRQRGFAANPDDWLEANHTRLLVHSPSLTSGISIEGPYFDKVFGLFEGQSSTPDDCLQALARYRRPVDRTVYASHYGKSAGIDARRTADYAASLARRQAMIERASGRVLPTLPGTDPFSVYHAETGAARNVAMADFGSSLRAALEAGGHLVEEGGEVDPGALEDATALWSQAGELVKADSERTILGAPVLSLTEALALRGRRSLEPAPALALERFEISDFYKIAPETLTLEDVGRDRRGRTRRRVGRIEALMWQGLARSKDDSLTQALEKWRCPVMSHDLPGSELFSRAAIALGVDDLIVHCVKEPGWHNTTPWVVDFAERIKANAEDAAIAIGFRVRDNMAPCQVVGMVLAHFGLTTVARRLTLAGVRVRIYELDPENLTWLRALLARRAESHAQQGFQVRPHPLTTLLLGGLDPGGDKSPGLASAYFSIPPRPPQSGPPRGGGG